MIVSVHVFNLIFICFYGCMHFSINKHICITYVYLFYVYKRIKCHQGRLQAGARGTLGLTGFCFINLLLTFYSYVQFLSWHYSQSLSAESLFYRAKYNGMQVCPSSFKQ